MRQGQYCPVYNIGQRAKDVEEKKTPKMIYSVYAISPHPIQTADLLRAMRGLFCGIALRSAGRSRDAMWSKSSVVRPFMFIHYPRKSTSALSPLAYICIECVKEF